MMAASSLSLSGALQQVGNHLWQSTLCLMVVALLTLVLRNNRAHIRHWLWLAASVKFLVPFAPLMAIGGQFGRQSLATVQLQTSFLVDTLSQPFSQPSFQFAATASSGSGIHSLWAAAPPLLVGVWFLGGAAVLLTWCTGWRRMSAAVRQGGPIEDGREVDTLRRLERIGGLNGSMALIGSNMSFEPGVFGIAKPVLLWPQDIGERLDDGQLEAILAHEVCHVRRRDNLAAAVHMVVEAMFWFHPLIWWVERRLVDERERACDEDVIRWGIVPHVYAESILKTCEFYLESPLACVSGVTGSDLKKRIEVIMTNRTTHALSTTKRLLLASACVAAVAGPIVVGLLNAPHIQAQSPVTLSRVAVRPEAFTIASIRQNPSAAAPQGNLPTVCGIPVPRLLPPTWQLPPAGSGPVLWLIAPCFAAQGNVSRIDVQTYVSVIQLQQKRSQPSQGIWTSYDDSLQQIIKDDFNRLWNTDFLADLRIDVTDYTFSNGVVGKIVVYNMEERNTALRASATSGQLTEWIQFDTKGVEFGPWLRGFVAQVKPNWMVPFEAMSSKDHVVMTFNVHKDGSITDLTIGWPSSVEAFNDAAFSALTASNPLPPLPPEYPADKAFFSVTFFHNAPASQAQALLK